MSFRVVLLGLIALTLVGGGGLVYLGWSGVADRLDSVEAKQEICSTLDDAERMDLVGVETPTKLLNVEGTLDEYTCRWATDDLSATVFVQAVSAPADKWATELKATFDPRATGGDPALQRRLVQALEQPMSTPEDACRVAQVMFRIGGASDGAERLVIQSASSSGMPAMIAQSCVEGTYSMVMVTAPGLALDRPLARKTAQALRTVEARIA